MSLYTDIYNHNINDEHHFKNIIILYAFQQKTVGAKTAANAFTAEIYRPLLSYTRLQQGFPPNEHNPIGRTVKCPSLSETFRPVKNGNVILFSPNIRQQHKILQKKHLTIDTVFYHLPKSGFKKSGKLFRPLSGRHKEKKKSLFISGWWPLGGRKSSRDQTNFLTISKTVWIVDRVKDSKPIN